MFANMRRWTDWAQARFSLTNLRNRSSGDERGATLAEYALLIALIAIVSVGSLVFLGQSTTRTLSLTASKVGSGATGPLGSGLGDISSPLNLAATPGVNAQNNVTIGLTWDPPAVNNSGYPIIGYDVFMGTASFQESATPETSTGTSDTVATLPDGTTLLAQGKQYFFLVQAVTDIGNSASSNEANATTDAKPGAPSLTGAVAGVRAVTLNWTAGSTGGLTIQGYNVFEGTSAGNESTTPVNTSPLSGTTTTYQVTGLANNTPYYFTVEAENQLGWSTASNEKSATTPNFPGAPTLTGTAESKQVGLSWTVPTSDGGSPISGYDVFQGATSGGESATPVNAAPITGTNYNVTGLTNGTTYYFTVKAINAVGLSGPSNEVSSSPLIGVPSPPTGLTATAGPNAAEVTLAWVEPADNGGCALQGYLIYDGTSPGSVTNYVTATIGAGTTEANITGLHDGTPYYFDVVAATLCSIITGVYSPPSNVASATPGTPSAPTLSAVPGSSQVTLNWTASTFKGTGFLGYDVYQGTAPGGESSTPVTGCALISAITCTVTGLTDGTTYYFTVKGMNSLGLGNASNEVPATPGTLPAPTGLTATAGDTTVLLNWTAPLGNGLLGYDVYDATSPGSEPYGSPVNGGTLISKTATTYTVTGLANGATYYFTVEAVNANGNSAPSNEASATPSGAPGAPSGLTASSAFSIFTGYYATLSWTAAAPNGSPISDYKILWGTSQTSLNKTFDTGSTNTTYNGALGTTLTAGTPYYFEVVAVNANGTGGPSNEASITEGTPSAPTLSVGSAGNGTVTLTWTAPGYEGILRGYNVYEGTSSGGESGTPVNGGTLIGNSPYTVTGLTNRVTYYFTVKAVNFTGIGTASNEVSAVAGVQNAPLNLTATAGNGTLTLNWTAPSNNGTPAITSYDVFESTTPGGEGISPFDSVVGNPPATTDTLSNLDDGVTYYFTVAAVNSNGVGPDSNEASATPGIVPGAPTALTAAGSNGSAALSWTAPGYTGTSPITGYQIFEGTSPGGENYSTPVATLVGNTTQDTLTGLTNGKTYYFTVEAMNATGNSIPSSEASAMPGIVPGAPTGLTATGQNGSVALSWTAPGNLGTPALTGYQVFQGTSPGGEDYSTVVASPTGTSATISGLTNGTTYYFTVEAVNATGNGIPSTEASAQPGIVPDAPTGLTASPGGNQHVLLSWTAPGNTGSSGLRGYDVYEGTSPGGESSTPVNGGTLVPGTTYTATGLTNGNTYYFTVKAVNQTGPGAASGEASAMAGSLPGTPTGLTASPGGNQQVSLSWTGTTGFPAPGYNVYEGTTTGGESTTPVNASPISGTTYTATGLTNGTPYYFTVKAVNAIGTGPASNEANAMAGSVPGTPTGLTASPGGDQQVSLTWNAATGFPAPGYNVYEGTSAGGESGVALNGGTPISGTTYTATGLTNGTTYYFKVRAVNALGTSGLSTEAKAQAGAVPGAPTGVTPTPGNQQVSLTWTAATGFPAPGYNVYEGTTSGGESGTPLNGGTPISGTTYTATGLTNGNSYYFTVKGVNALGTGPASTEVKSIPVGPPDAPTGLTAAPGLAQISLSWTAPGNDGGSAIQGYNVYEGTTSGGESNTPVNGTLISGTGYTATSLTNRTTYYFTVKAVNAVGTGPASTEASATAGAPLAPTGLTATENSFLNTKINLSWTAPATNGTPNPTGYKIYYGTASGQETTLYGTVGAVTNTIVTMPAGLTKYYFIVEATNGNGSGPPSNEASATTGL